jgi:hypothetical protein
MLLLLLLILYLFEQSKNYTLLLLLDTVRLFSRSINLYLLKTDD